MKKKMRKVLSSVIVFVLLVAMILPLLISVVQAGF